MTRNQIISELYLSKDIKQALNKMQPANLRDELKQEMFVSLCSISDEKFWHLHENNALKYWLVRCMLNMIYSTKTNQTFFRYFRMKMENIDNVTNLYDEIDIDKIKKEELLNNLENKINDLSWYEKELLNTWADLKFNQKEISRKTGISYPSIVKTISIIKQKLRDE